MEEVKKEFRMDGFLEVVDLSNGSQIVRTTRKRYDELRYGWNTQNYFEDEGGYQETDGCLFDLDIFKILKEEEEVNE